jgi:pyruvate/2-oxoglutarate dehydrogenase complex dihydrolipoamide acyltransferase (E2) component
MSGDENLWYVKTDDGDVHRVTLDQLDEAFQAGRIDENVMVLAAGATKWAKLSALAGLDEPAPSPIVPNSLRPVSMDLSLDMDLDENAFRKKSRKGLVIGTVVGLLAVFGGILVMNRSHIGSDTTPVAAAAAAPIAPPAPPPVVAASPDPAPPMPLAPAPLPTAETNASKLNDDQKVKLAAADKALEQKSKVRKKNRAAAAVSSPHSSTKYKSQGFTTGGNKFDPLNAGP